MNDEFDHLKRLIVSAVTQAAERLFNENSESFYYFTLVTSGEAHAPIVSAWSWERLAMIHQDERHLLKWSYADSPYFDFNSEGFDLVRSFFNRRPNILLLDNPLALLEYEERLAAMECALSEVDAAGVFGRGKERAKIVINVEVMPPDHSNTERAIRLNPPEALGEWLKEAAE